MFAFAVRILRMKKERERMDRRKKIRAASFMLAVTAALLIWGITGAVQVKRLERDRRAEQQRALSQTDEFLDGMTASLQKAVYASSPAMLSRLCGQLRTQAGGAKLSLSALSSGDTQLYNMYKFMSQVAEYTESLNQKAAAGGTLTAGERETLKKLLANAQRLSAQFGYMSDLMDAGLFSFEELRRGLAAADSGTGDTVSYLNAAADAEDSLQELPTLIYDGPFSDHITEKTSVLLKNAAEVSVTKAKEIAAAALRMEPRELMDAAETAGRLPTYNFYRDKTRIAVTVNGGYPAYILTDHVGGAARVSAEEAVSAAGTYLRELGYAGMEPTYHADENGVCTVNFAYREGEYLCYPDLIKVGVSLSDGSIVTLDARDYLMNHVRRTVPDEAVTAEQAAASVTPGLQVKNIKKAVIPTGGGYEKYAYELLCADAGQDVLIYVDTVTGQEDDILLLLYADGGTLTK